MFLIKEMPKEERPRERLIKYGARALSNVELIAILLRTGNTNKSVIELAKEVYYKLDEISYLNKISLEELLQINGIKTAKAATLLAAIELGKRLNVKKSNNQIQMINSSYDVYEIMSELNNYEQEHFYCLFLDIKFNVIKKELIYVGTVNEIVIHPREVFKQGIKYNSSYVIFVHNHPSGDPEPSGADIETTNILQEAANFLYIPMLDHIIIGKNCFYSFKEQQIYEYK